jgi:hypothetical protein
MLDGYTHSPMRGYHRVLPDGRTPVLRPWTNDLPKRRPGDFDNPGADRGGVLFQGPRSPTPTASLQTSNAIDVDGDGYTVTLPRAARGVSISFTNVGAFSIAIYAHPRIAHQFEIHADVIDGTDLPYTLDAGAAVTFKCSENCRWVSA